VTHPDPDSEEFRKLQQAVLYHFHDILQEHRLQLSDEIARFRRETADLIASTLEIHKSNDYVARDLKDFPAPLDAPIAVGQPTPGTDSSLVARVGLERACSPDLLVPLVLLPLSPLLLAAR
jgi:hypothetical protein